MGCTLAESIALFGRKVEFKRSAGIFVAGISLFLGGPLLSYAGILFMALSASRNDRGLTAVFVSLSIFGALLGLVGFFMLLVATHRALIKIDALPVRIQSAQRQSWPADRV
jgi:hypothetical protein